MIDSTWRRIAGIHVEDEGEIAAVWFSHDKTTDCVHLYDCAIFRREVLAVIGEGLNVRGRWIPIAWEKSAEDMANKLLERGCNILPEAEKETDAVREVGSREIWERMRTGRFKVDKRMAEWLDEYRSFYRQEGQVPKTSHPFMSATRHAITQLPYARAQKPQGRPPPKNHRKVAIV